MRSLIAALVLMLVTVAAPVFAQNPVNPTTAMWDSVDHAGVDSYEIGYFAGPTTVAPIQTAPIAKPAACAPCTVSILASRPTGFQVWYGAVRAIAGTLASGWSNRVPFDRSPVAPTNFRVQ